ncbi:MAG: ribosome silencing factor [Anaerolineae bacterium]|nr:ribosome silencing factor [Anaerolineae bacterium]
MEEGSAILDSLELARHVVELIADQKGENVLLLDIRDISILADYFVIASTTSDRQAKAVLDDVREKVKQDTDARLLHIEGEPSTGWVLMDYGDVVVHIFSQETRAYYDLEGLWQEGRVVVRML